MLRKKASSKFVEFYGDGLNALSLGDRGTISNMAPRIWRDHGVFPSTKRRSNIYADQSFAGTNRSGEAYAKEQGCSASPARQSPSIATRFPWILGRRAIARWTQAAAGSHQPAGREENFSSTALAPAQNRPTSR